MAQAKFFKKTSPNDPVILANNQRLNFKTVDYRVGYFSTDSESLQNELLNMVRAGQYGLSEVSWDEFDKEFLKKKTSNPLRKLWREEATNSGIKTNPLQDLFQEENAVVVKPDKKPLPVTMAELPPEIAPKKDSGITAPDEFKPDTGRRAL